MAGIEPITSNDVRLYRLGATAKWQINNVIGLLLGKYEACNGHWAIEIATFQNSYIQVSSNLKIIRFTDGVLSAVAVDLCHR